MKLSGKIQEYIREHKLRKRWRRYTAVLAGVVVSVTSAALILPAITMENAPSLLECQLDLHTHTDNCYDEEGNIVCGYADFVVHTHDASCYAEDGTLICTLPEIRAHAHDSSCYQEALIPICGQEESAGHIHDESCYQTAQEPSCDLEEAAAHVHQGHIHTENCWESAEELICGLKESTSHTHGEGCYDAEGNVICQEPEVGHAHTSDCYETLKTLICTEATGCYDEGGNLVCNTLEENHVHTEACCPQEPVCGQEEAPAHTHTEACFEMQKKLVCGQEEIILHTHTDACYNESGSLICGMLEVVEHIHNESCLASQAVNSVLQVQSGAKSIDFSDMITGITLQVQQDGYWVDLIGDTVEENSSLRVRIDFTIEGGTLFDGNRTIHYQLPDGIRLNERESGKVDYTDGVPAGTYTIDTNGYVEIVFNEDFPVDQDFGGYLQFEGTVALVEGEGGGNIDFGGDGGSITIVPEKKELDLSISKTGIYNKETGKIEYNITVSSENGTNGENVHIGDWFQHPADYGTIWYDVESLNDLHIQKTSDTGSEEVQLATEQFAGSQQTDTQPGWWTIYNMPPLGRGESYEISYTATPDLANSGDANGHLEFSNVAGAQSGGKTVTANATVILSQAVIQKEVTNYTPYERSVTWTIYIRNSDGRDLAGETLEDEMFFLPDGASAPTWYASPAGVTVTVETYDHTDINFNTPIDTVVRENVTFPITFSQDSVYSYKLTYTTVLPEDLAGQTGYFGNRAEFLGREVVVGTELEIPDPIGYDVVKNYWGKYDLTDESGNAFTSLKWGTTVTYPENAAPENLIFIDLIPDAVTDSGETVRHYTTPEALNTGGVLAATLDWETVLQQGVDYNVFVLLKEDQPDYVTAESFGTMNIQSLLELEWHEYGEVAQAVEYGYITKETPISMIRVVLTEEGLAKLGGHPMVIQYYTVMDSPALPADSTLTTPNLARIPAAWSYAEYEEKFLKRLDKQVSFIGPDMNTGDVSSYDDHPAGTVGEDGIIYYRLLLTDFLRDGTGGATVTDILPKGAELVGESVYLVAHDQYAGTAEYVDWERYYMTYSTTPGDNGTTITFTLSRLNELDTVEVLGIYYAVSVAEDPAWSSQSSRNYTNTAYWDGETDSTITTVTQTLPLLKKSGDQLVLSDGTPSSVVRYYVVVNPNGEQLLEEPGRTLTLTDTLSIPEGAAAQLLLETAQVCYYDPSQEHGIGQPLADSTYTIRYDGQTHILTVEIPDATACVVVYDYEINRGNSDIVNLTVDNSATLEGHAAVGSDFDIVITEQSSSAGVNTANLILYKVNSENNAQLLNGALFRLERFEQQENGGYQWEQTSITAVGEEGQYETGGDGPVGQIILNFLNTEGNSRYDTIYRIRETKPPDGYQITDDGYLYFVWMEKDATEQSTIMAMRDAFAVAEINSDQVIFIPYNANYSLYIENEPLTTSIRVEKKWESPSGEALTEDLPGSVTLTLCQWLDGERTSYEDTVIITPGENVGWTHTWDNLPKYTDVGSEYTYTVEEIPIDGYEVSYIYSGSGDGETGITGGTITITNRKTTGYVLPETGGTGKYQFLLAGLLLTGVACTGAMLLRRRERRRNAS